MNQPVETIDGGARGLLPQRRTMSSSQSRSLKAPASRQMQRRSPRPACVKQKTIRNAASLRMNGHTGMWEVVLQLTGNHPRTTTRRICLSSAGDLHARAKEGPKHEQGVYSQYNEAVTHPGADRASTPIMLPQQTESLNRMSAYICQSDTNICRCTSGHTLVQLYQACTFGTMSHSPGWMNEKTSIG